MEKHKEIISNIKEIIKNDQNSLSPPRVNQMFKNDSNRKEVSKMLSMKIELSKMNRKDKVPVKEKRLGTGAK